MWRKTLLAALVMALFAVVLVHPATAQNPVWSAEYYNNPTLSGPATLSRQDSAIAFNWGDSSPGVGINSDNFSVRWATDVSLPAGTYRFFAQADDDIRVIVDFQQTPLIDTFGQAQVGQLVTRDITLGAGSHHIQVDYREITSNAYVFVTFANLATNPTGPNFPPPINFPVIGGIWTAQYYANPDLSGSPSLIQSESDPSHNWGNGSPAPSIPADNWSARWTTVPMLTGGNYDISVLADDGVRVFVDGVLYINEWHAATGQTYRRTLALPAGQHNILVEFFESGGLAYLDFRFTQLNPPTPTATPTTIPATPFPPGTTTATVNTGRLNVRAIPDPVNGAILLKIDRGQTFPVVGRNSDGSWLQLNVNGTIGWVNASYVVINNPGVIPTTIPTQIAPPSTGVTVTATIGVNIRSAPTTTDSDILAVLRQGQTAQVVGRSAGNFWWQINYNGIVGWVYSGFAPLQPGANPNAIPITG